MKKLRPLTLCLLTTLLLTSCGKNTVVKRETTIGQEQLNVIMPTGKDVVHPVHGKEVWFAVGAMTGNDSVNANGVAQSHVFADTSTTATISLNIQPAPKGYKHVGWLQKPGTIERARLDALVNPLNDVRHVITVDIAKDLRAFTDVLVTLERESGPSDTDPIEAKGTLKEQRR